MVDDDAETNHEDQDASVAEGKSGKKCESTTLPKTQVTLDRLSQAGDQNDNGHSSTDPPTDSGQKVSDIYTNILLWLKNQLYVWDFIY